MLRRRPESGGDQERAEFVAVQGDGMRLVIHPRAGSRSPWVSGTVGV